ncbi:MAG TPA: YggT family protein [Actinomycetota bacterium]|jgi:YggT family protein|nr:YggT family protein [Actinomycetota bacterium]
MTRIVCILLTLYWFVLFVRILMSWFPAPRSGAGQRFFEIVYDITEPVLKLVRGLLPPIRMGAMGMDLSPIIVFVAIGILQAALGCSFGL